MAGIYGLSREAVRVKVKKLERNLAPEWRKFSVDPQITSLEVLYSILAKAFDLKSDFSISYKAIDPCGQDVMLPVLSDWDLDAAFLRAHNHSISTATDPCLSLQVEIKPFSEASDWEQSNPSNREPNPSIQQSFGAGQKYVQTMQTRLPGLIMNHMEKTFSMVTRALNFVEDQSILQPLRQPLSDAEFHSFLDSVGQIIQPNSLRKVIYSGGIEPSLRRVVWKHILNVYPDGMTGLQRMDYMKRKAQEYHRLRDIWRAVFQSGSVSGELAYVTGMVQKDVLRTDRLHPFYAGNDDNQNITSLFNILTTYALNHPAVSYCQGMSDIASPLLVTMRDEAQAYICFCAVMKRLNINFMLDGIAMTQKFAHLSEALQFYDPEFFEYLKMQQADDLLFCYRWLLLEMKREFAFDDSLRMLEVLWSSLPPQAPTNELHLFEKEFVPPVKDSQSPPKSSSSSVTMRKPRENAYTKLCALRRQSSSQSLLATSPSALSSMDSINSKSLDATKRLNQSLDENVTRNQIAGGRNISKSFQSLDETKLRNIARQQKTMFSIETNEKSPFNDLEVKNNEKNQHQTSLQSPTANNGESSATVAKQEEHPIENNNTQSHLDRTNSVGAGHFKDLKDRLAAGKKEIFASLDKIEKFPFKDSGDISSDTTSEDSTQKSGKIVKNFSEFLNLASKTGAKLTLNRSNSVTTREKRTRTSGLRATRSSHQSLDAIKASDQENQIQNNNEADSQINRKTFQLQLEDKRQQSLDGSSPDDSQEYFPMTTSITRELRLELDNLNRQVFGNSFSPKLPATVTHTLDCNSPGSTDSRISNNRSPRFASEFSYTKLNQNSEDEPHLDKIYTLTTDVDVDVEDMNTIKVNDNKRASTIGANGEVFVWENPLHQLSPTPTNDPNVKQSQQYLTENKNPFYAKDFLQTLTPDEQNELDYDGELIDESCGGKKSITVLRKDENKAISSRNNGSTSKRNSNIFRNDSDTDSSIEISERDVNLIMKTSTFSETNPFLMDIVSSMGQTSNPSPPIIPNENGGTTIDEPFVDEEASEAETNIVLEKVNTSLPAPSEFGGGNPFLMFLCLTLLLQHRTFVMKNNMDYNEIAMHFDKMVRKHNVVRVLNQARRMYADYLKSQNMRLSCDKEPNNINSIPTTNFKSDLHLSGNNKPKSDIPNGIHSTANKQNIA